MYSYGYGDLEDKLIDLFRSGAPDFAEADRLIALGADVNAEGKADDENILSEILTGYWWSEMGDTLCDEGCDSSMCKGCPKFESKNPNCGETMVEVIRYFLSHGFDVNKKNGRYGAQCLWALTLSVFDFHMIDAIKLLLNAGAQNISISESDDETPWDFIGTEGSYQDTCCHDHHLGNIYEAAYQIYQALEDGRPFQQINSYEFARGRVIRTVYAEKPQRLGVFFRSIIPHSRHRNCFTSTLYFQLDDSVLVTTQYGDFWLDTLPEGKDLIDVSVRFAPLLGARIVGFQFGHNEVVKGTTHYGQPVTTIEMSNGHSVTFTINFGEVEKKDRFAYFTLS